MDYTRDEWHSRCRDCAHHTRHGMARVYAETSSSRHLLRKPSHRTYEAFYDVTPASALDESPTAPTLFDLASDDAPPF